MKALYMALIAFLAFQFWGCRDKDQTDSLIVRNGIDRIYKRIDYQVVRTYGGEDQTQAIGRPAAINADMKGNIYVLDGMQETILKFDPELNYITNIGRSGQGPGEFEGAICMSIDWENELYVFDSSMKLEVFSDKGELMQTIKTDLEIEKMIFDQGPGLLTIGHSKFIYNKNPKHELDAIRYYCLGDMSLKDMSIVDFFSKERFVYSRIGNSDIKIVIPDSVLFTVYHGDIYVCTGNKYEITIYGKDRKIKKKIMKAYKPIPISDKAMKFGKKFLNNDSPLREQFARIAKYQPVMTSIAVDEKGRIWIELFKPYKKDDDSYQTNYDIFSKEGKYLFTAEINERVLRPPIFKNNNIYCAVENETGEYAIKKIKIANKNF